jgi:hypothetical protein
MAKAYGINPSTFNYRVKKGLSLKETLTKPLPEPVTDHLGNTYPTMAHMAKAYGMTRNTLCGRLEAGASLEDALTAKPNALRNIGGEFRQKRDSHGEPYSSLNELCDRLGISVSAYLYRLRHNIPLDQKNNIQPVKDHKGIEYPSIAAMLRAYKVQTCTFQKRRKKGWTLEECLMGRKKKKSRPTKSQLIESTQRMKASKSRHRLKTEDNPITDK